MAQGVSRGQQHHTLPFCLGRAYPFRHLRQRPCQVALDSGRVHLRRKQLQGTAAANHQLCPLQVCQRGAAQAGDAIVQHADDSAFFYRRKVF